MTRRRTSNVRRTSLCLAMLMTLASLSAGLSTHAVGAARAASCGTATQTKTPVLMVHGFTSDSSMWTAGSPSMVQAIAAATGVQAQTFDYGGKSTQWVKDSGSGAALAGQIDCLAKGSADLGGPGKVVLVAHSMGGLAIRCATDTACSGADVSSRIGLVITLDTPNLGTSLAGTHTPVGDIPASRILASVFSAAFCGSAVGATLCKLLPAGSLPVARRPRKR